MARVCLPTKPPKLSSPSQLSLTVRTTQCQLCLSTVSVSRDRQQWGQSGPETYVSEGMPSWMEWGAVIQMAKD